MQIELWAGTSHRWIRRTRSWFGAIAILGLLGGQASAQSLGSEWTAVPAEKAKIIFVAPGLDDKIGRYMQMTDDGFSYTLEVAFWTGFVAPLPTAIVHYFKALPGHHIRDEYDPKTFVKSFKFFKDKGLRFESRHNLGNKLGQLGWRRFSFDDIACVGFVEYFGISSSDGPTVGTDRISGYYCADPGSPLSDEAAKAALKGLGLRGEE